MVEKSLLVSILQRTVDAAKDGEGGVDGPGHFAHILRALVQAGITRVIRQWVFDLVQGPKELCTTEFLKNILSTSIDLPVNFVTLKMSKASRILISAAKNWEDEEVKRLGKRLKAKWHSRLRNDQSEEESQALSDRMDRHMQKQQQSSTSGGGQKQQQQLISQQVTTANDMVVEPSITKIDHNEPPLEGKVSEPPPQPIEETLMGEGEGSGGEEGEEDTYLEPALPPAKRPHQPTLAAPQPRPAKRGMKMKVLTGDLADGSSSSTAADIPGSVVVASTKYQTTFHDAGQPQSDGDGTDPSMPHINLHDIPSGEDKARTTVGSSEGDEVKDEDVAGGSDVVVAMDGTRAASAMDSPHPELLPEGEGGGGGGLSSSVMPPRVLSSPVKCVAAPMEDVKPESIEAPPPLPSTTTTTPSEVMVTTTTSSQPAVGFGKGLSRSIDYEKQSPVLLPTLQASSSSGEMPTGTPKLLSRSSLKGSTGSERPRSVICHTNHPS